MAIPDRGATRSRAPRSRGPRPPTPPARRRPPSRVVIESVRPEIDAGRFPAKAVVGDPVVVEADVYADGHDQLAAELRWRAAGSEEWSSVPMQPLVNDRWRASFVPETPGRHEFTLSAWIDPFGSWLHGIRRKAAAGQDVSSDLLVGADLLGRTAKRVKDPVLKQAAALVREGDLDAVDALGVADIARSAPDRASVATYARTLAVEAEPERAAYGAWYEFFPRSAAPDPGRHGTLADAAERLDYVAGMRFDVVYLPPVHPIGETKRKGKDNAPTARPGEPGTPWAIGSRDGGHTALHPQLGTIEDFDKLVARAGELGIDIAMDLALQCSPDHPWVSEHPEWFKHRPDGTIQYAENPPKRYEDIYPLDFECDDWQSLWAEVERVVMFWIGRGIRVFRVDNPHTKPFALWEWLFTRVREREPGIVFLAEAFTRPKVMYRLAKLGFSQSYTYFAWRTTKWELTEYCSEIMRPPVSDYFRPNFWPNTPDILTPQLQTGGRPTFVSRFVLAATLGASYGIYGPPFEHCLSGGAEGREEYANNEKYEIRHWDLDRPDSLSDLIKHVNQIRRTNPALQRNDRLVFHNVDNDALIAYSKTSADRSNAVLCVVNLDPAWPQAGWLDLRLDELGLDWDDTYQVHDLLTDARYLWTGPRNFVRLDPNVVPAHVFALRRRVASEHDFEYYI